MVGQRSDVLRDIEHPGCIGYPITKIFIAMAFCINVPVLTTMNYECSGRRIELV